jgi:hypothetical protein
MSAKKEGAARFFRAHRLINAAKNSTDHRTTRAHLEDLCVYSGIVDRGYDKYDCVVLCNWNTPTHYDGERYVEEDDTLRRLSDLLERTGVYTDWKDEYDECSECGKLARTSPDCYSWEKAYIITDGGLLICRNCIDADELVKEYEGNKKMLTTELSIHPEDHGYRNLLEHEENTYSKVFQYGLHDGQNEKPEMMHTWLHTNMCNRFLFRVEDVSQFYISWSVWIHESDFDRVHKLYLGSHNICREYPSPADKARDALRNAPHLPAVPGMVNITSINVADGTSTTRSISQQEFAERGMRGSVG